MLVEKIDMSKMCLGEIVLAQMLGEIPLNQLDEAKKTANARNNAAVSKLRDLAITLAGMYFPQKSKKTVPCKNYYQYLTTLHAASGLDLEKMLKEQELDNDERRFLRNYMRMEKGRGGIAKTFEKVNVYTEVIIPRRWGAAALISVREKELARIVRKTSKRIIEHEQKFEQIKKQYQQDLIKYQQKHGDNANPEQELDDNSEPSSQKPKLKWESIEEYFRDPEIRRKIYADDTHGVMIYASNEDMAKHLAYDLFFEQMEFLGFMPDPYEEPKEYSKKYEIPLDGSQIPGIDDHYQYKESNVHQVQTKIRNNDYNGTCDVPPGIWEVVFTDLRSSIFDQMDHFEFRRKQERKHSDTYGSKRDLRRYNQYIYVGHLLLPSAEITSGDSEHRRKRVMSPHFYFK